jgi:hypothetical protein
MAGCAGKSAQTGTGSIERTDRHRNEAHGSCGRSGYFVEAIFARQRAWGKRAGLVAVQSGAVTHVQRFGSSINLNVHFHVMVLDGVFTYDEQAGSRFHPTPPPTRGELLQIVRRVHRKAVAWLSRNGYLRERSLEGRSQAMTAQTSLEACAAIAIRRGEVRALRDQPPAEQSDDDPVQAPSADGGAVEYEAFNLHASVAIAADDDLGRERLMRYGARPPLALDRLRRWPGNRIAYRIKKLRDGRAKSRIMTPLEFLARLQRCRSCTGPGLGMKHTERHTSGRHGEARVNAESACGSRPVDASETFTVAVECEDRGVVQHQYEVVRLTANASLFSMRGVNRLEGHLVVVQEPVQTLELPFTPHRFGKAQARVARKLAGDSFQPLATTRVSKRRAAILRRHVFQLHQAALITSSEKSERDVMDG